MIKCSIAVLFSFIFLNGHAQIDKEFWFAAPEISENHDDRPIYINITCQDKPCNIEVSQPANQNFNAYTLSLPARSYRKLELTADIEAVETKPGFTVLNTGMFLKGDNYFAANYEVEGNNSDIFTLKGRKALGQEFIGQFQDSFPTRGTVFDGGPSLNAFHSLDVVATENNTEITITPAVDLENHPEGVPFTVTLNKGQTYSVVNKSLEKGVRLNGTIITSNKPVAVTKKDDSVFKGINWDLIGDQLLPVSGFDTSFVAYNGFINIISSADNNNIRVGDSTFTLNKNAYAFFAVKDEITDIHAEKPVGVFQTMEVENELSGSVVAPIRCTGSREVSFQRSEDPYFQMFILTKRGNSDFTINEQPFDALQFQALNEDYHYAIIEDDDFMFLEPDFFYTIESPEDFQLSILFGSGLTGASYGFFSDFGFVELQDSVFSCNSQNILLDAGPSMDSYQWSTGSDSSTTLTTGEGSYTIITTKDICTFEDTTIVNFVEGVSVSLKPDTFVCQTDSILLQLKEDPTWNYVWNTGDSSSGIYVTTGGDYEAFVTNQYNCSDSAQTSVDLFQKPFLSLPNDTIICENSNYILGANHSADFEYSWNTGATTPSIPIEKPGLYTVSVENKCGFLSGDVNIDFWQVYIPNVITPNQDGKNDAFVIQAQESGIWELQVYNRWGSKVFHSYNYQNDFMGEDLLEGTYYYSAKEKYAFCTKQSGWLMILK